VGRSEQDSTRARTTALTEMPQAGQDTCFPKDLNAEQQVDLPI
jgi:hypothetical protein